MTDNPRQRDTAASYLDAADRLICDITVSDAEDPDRLIALAQTHSLIAIGHALVDFAKDGVGIYH
jgi:hypothetical protein